MYPDRPVKLQERACTSYRVVGEAHFGSEVETRHVHFSSEVREEAERWVKRFAGYGMAVHLEKWEGTYFISPTNWVRVDV